MRIEITARTVYGQTKFYPSNHQARMLAEIAGTATLTERALMLAREMGCEIVLNGDKTLAQFAA